MFCSLKSSEILSFQVFINRESTLTLSITVLFIRSSVRKQNPLNSLKSPSSHLHHYLFHHPSSFNFGTFNIFLCQSPIFINRLSPWINFIYKTSFVHQSSSINFLPQSTIISHQLQLSSFVQLIATFILRLFILFMCVLT